MTIVASEGSSPLPPLVIENLLLLLLSLLPVYRPIAFGNFIRQHFFRFYGELFSAVGKRCSSRELL